MTAKELKKAMEEIWAWPGVCSASHFIGWSDLDSATRVKRGDLFFKKMRKSVLRKVASRRES